MLRGAFIVQHFTQASQCNARCLAYDGGLVLHTVLNKWQQLIHVGTNVLGASLNTHTKRHHGSLAMHRIWVVGVSLHLLKQHREDMIRGKLCGQLVDDAKSETRRRVFLNVIRVFLCSHGHQFFDHRLGEARALNTRALVLNSPHKRIEAHKAQILFVVAVGAVLHEASHKFGEMSRQNGRLKHAHIFEYIKDLTHSL